MWSLSLTCLYVFSRSPCALSVCSTIALSLCPGVFGRYSSFPLILQPLQWLHGLATQLGAHYLLIHRRDDRQRRPAPFLCRALPAPIILSLSLSLSPPQHFLSKKDATSLSPLSRSSHRTLRYSTSSPHCIMSPRVLRGINSSISIY